jgi:predicted CopG family antitoxin
MYMSKNVMLSDDAYEALLTYKKEGESFSDVIKRLAPPPIRTFGDLEKHLENAEGPLFSDMKALERIKLRKRQLDAH